MKLPLDLVNVLNWKESESTGDKIETNDSKTEEFVNRIINAMYPVFDHLVQFGVDYHRFMDNKDIKGLQEFIERYSCDSYCRLVKFAKGLQKDYDAVKNALLFPEITNGPVEGKNGSIKCDKRVYGGRAKIDLLVAKALLRQQYTAERAVI